MGLTVLDLWAGALCAVHARRVPDATATALASRTWCGDRWIASRGFSVRRPAASAFRHESRARDQTRNRLHCDTVTIAEHGGAAAIARRPWGRRDG